MLLSYYAFMGSDASNMGNFRNLKGCKMKTIVIKTQKEWDNLPESFKEFTVIEVRSRETITIRSNPNNSSARLYDSSSAELYHSSSAVLYDSSSAELYHSSSATLYGSSSAELYHSSSAELYHSSSAELFNFSSAHCFCGSAKAYENSYLSIRGKGFKYEIFDSAKAIDNTKLNSPDFDTWLSRGYVVADGIYQELKSQKSLGEVTIYETDKGFVARKGNKFAHGETIEKACDDLRYKISDRDTSKFKSWTLDTTKPLDNMIEAYITITGACSLGAKMFCQEKQLKDNYSVKEVIDLTVGRFGHEQFKEFFNE